MERNKQENVQRIKTKDRQKQKLRSDRKMEGDALRKKKAKKKKRTFGKRVNETSERREGRGIEKRSRKYVGNKMELKEK